MNLHTNGSIIASMVNDPALDVRQAIASSKNTPGPVLKQLYEIDQSDDIVYNLTQNPNAPASLLREMAEPGKIKLGYLAFIAQNPNTPLHLLLELAKHPDGLVRLGVARNKNAPPELLQRMIASGESVVAKAARKTLKGEIQEVKQP